jgi:hypothetical protein
LVGDQRCDELPFVVLLFLVIDLHTRSSALGCHAGDSWRNLHGRPAGKSVSGDRGWSASNRRAGATARASACASTGKRIGAAT